MSTLRELGAQLRSRRRERGESQEATAAAVGVTRQWLARVEAGTGNPDLRQLFALCDHLDLHLTASPSARAATKRSQTERVGGLAHPPTGTSAKPVRDAKPALAPRARRPVKTSSAGKAEKAEVPARLRAAKATPQVDLDQLLGRYGTGARSRSPATRPTPKRVGKPGRG